MVALAPSFSEAIDGDEDWTLTDAPAGMANARTAAAATPAPANAGRSRERVFMRGTPSVAWTAPVHKGWWVLHRARAGRGRVRPARRADRRATAGRRGATGS